MCSLKLVSFSVVLVTIALAFPPPLPTVNEFLENLIYQSQINHIHRSYHQVTDLPQEKWNELFERAQIRLEQLAKQQGHRIKLLRINNAQEQMIAGHRFSINGQFQRESGDEVECTYDLWKAESDGFEEYNLYCGENEYRWSLGQRDS